MLSVKLKAKLLIICGVKIRDSTERAGYDLLDKITCKKVN